MTDAKELKTFKDLDDKRYLEVTELEHYGGCPPQFEPSVEIEMGHYEAYDGVLANFTPEDALEIGHIILRQARLALAEKWRRENN